MAIFNGVDTFVELRDAIAAANTNQEADTINLTGDIVLPEALPLIEEDVSLTINGGGFSVSGDKERRIFFVKGGVIKIDGLTLKDGLAQGTSPGGGGGAGMGGALFIYDGDVEISNSVFERNRAIGGRGGSSGLGGPGGGISGLNRAFDGSDGTDGAPGLDGSDGSDGGFGGQGGNGGRGGDVTSEIIAQGGDGGNGGFGGGGGEAGGSAGKSATNSSISSTSYNPGIGGDGGFGGGGGSGSPSSILQPVGTPTIYYSKGGLGGFGGGDTSASSFVLGNQSHGSGDGMGGAIFVRTGELSISDTFFSANKADGTVAYPSFALNYSYDSSNGLGGAIFALDTTVNPNGNNQGMPETLPVVVLDNVRLDKNQASSGLAKVTAKSIQSTKKYNNGALYGATISGTIFSKPRKNIDGDGFSDLVRRDRGTGKATVELLNNAGVKQTVEIGPSIRSDRWQLKGSGQFSDSDNSSFFWRNRATGQNILWSLDELDVKNAVALKSLSRNWDIKGIEDFDADGYSDILWYDSEQGKAMVWFMNQAEVRSEVTVGMSAPSGYMLEGTGDFDADGFSDFLWRDLADGVTKIWRMEVSVRENFGYLTRPNRNIEFLEEIPINTPQLSDWVVSGVADYSGNDQADIVWENTATGSYELWSLNEGLQAINGTVLASKTPFLTA